MFDFIATAYAEVAAAPTEPGHVITVWLFEHPETLLGMVSPFICLLWYYIRKVNKMAEEIATLLTQMAALCDSTKRNGKRIGRIEDSVLQLKDHLDHLKEEINRCIACEMSPVRTLTIEKENGQS